MIPRFKPWLDHRELLALFRCSRGAVERFEGEFASEFQAKEAVAFPYGRSALWAFLQAVGVTDAEVVMPAYTCSVVAHAITLSGNRPCFVDIRPDDYNMDLDLLEDVINHETRAIVATHLFGYPLDLDRLEQIVSNAEVRYGHKIWLIQDCAHSFGASWNGRLVGTAGDAALYGLNISKMMTSIFGGMLTFNDKSLSAKVRAWRDAHFRRPTWRKALKRCLYLLATYIAFNEKVYGLTWWLQERTPLLNRFTKAYHLDDVVHFPPDYLDQMLDIEAAIGLVQLAKYPEIIARRRASADSYSTLLPAMENWVMPPRIDGATYSHYVVRVPDRELLSQKMADRGIHLGQLIQYSVPHLRTYSSVPQACEASLDCSRQTINFPMYASLSQDQREQVVRALKACHG